MEKIVSLCKRRGFIFQSSEIYGGINGFWDYGPLGAELKRNVKELWWRTMTRQREDVVGLEATIIMHPQIWRASGHVDTFSDPMCDCLVTRKRFRADQIEPQSGTVHNYLGAVSSAALDDFLKTIECASQDFLNLTPLETKLFAATTPAQVATAVAEWARSLKPDGVNEAVLAKATAALQATVDHTAYAVLIAKGKHPEYARKVARQFYGERGLPRPRLFGERLEEVENSTRFNPDNGSLLTPPVPFNLMFKTYVGPTATEADVAYLRPETAQAIFAQFKNVLDTARQKVPFGIGQIGKAFRNEVTPRNFTFRSREFEQMELEFFIKPDEAIEAIHGAVATLTTPDPKSKTPEPQPNWGWQAWHQYWVEERVRFYEGIGLSRETLGFHHQTPEELAHYARACTDILFKFPFSKKDAQGNVTGDELEGIAARGDFDLSQHQRHSGKPMEYFDDELKGAFAKLDEAKKKDLLDRFTAVKRSDFTKRGYKPEEIEAKAKEAADRLSKGFYVPHVIEPSAGADRLILALICNAYREEMIPDSKGTPELRVMMKFHPRIAPVKVGVFPLLKNRPELVAKARQIFELLRPHMTVQFDDAGSIGKRYARQDEAGTPFGVTIDFDTLGEKPELLDTVTLRDRDTTQQTRVKISELLPLLLEKLR
ncbi:hypothetical protein LBMAG56_08390 [Verrucomicrobiota bacterium]|nr:hypothetical protein LBMAG56_08390 [Verrucomicrobiota bacterium]